MAADTALPCPAAAAEAPFSEPPSPLPPSLSPLTINPAPERMFVQQENRSAVASAVCLSLADVPMICGERCRGVTCRCGRDCERGDTLRRGVYTGPSGVCVAHSL